MSQIFDALQKSEVDRSGKKFSDLPVGPELLKQAERLAASTWDADATARLSEAAAVLDGERIAGHTNGALGASGISVPDDAVAWREEERTAFLRKVDSLPVSVQPESRLTFLTDRQSPTAESMRLLSVRLRDYRRKSRLKKVLITSSIPREGKSMIAANLACALAHGGKERVVLIEGDIRIPTIRKVFGIEMVPGLCECIQEERSLSECIHYLDGAGPWLLPTGQVPSNPLAVLESPKLASLMDQLAGCFDWVIIDSPPVLPLADTSIWMRLADGILMVVRQGTSEKQQLQRGLEALEQKKLLGALLNCAASSVYSDYYYRASSES